MIYRRFIKRMLDIVLSFAALIILSPITMVLAVAIKADSPGPVFFKQKRIGAGKSTFTIVKFRSMPTEVNHNAPTHCFNEQDMLTPLQSFLRRFSIDELPQLVNILSGKMSIVGPRPALWNQDDLIAEREKYGANDIRPGLTGPAQIGGRDTLSIAEKARLDGEYAGTLKAGGFRAFFTDARCVFGTISRVIRRDGVVEGGVKETWESNV